MQVSVAVKSNWPVSGIYDISGVYVVENFMHFIKLF